MQNSDADGLKEYVELSPRKIQDHLRAILAREPRGRQEPFTAVETLLCYGLFQLVNPHKYGGGNIDRVPEVVKTLARLFRRSPGSITSKMLNLDGSRTNGKRQEPLLYATLAEQPALYSSLYIDILREARNIGLEEALLPDFLHLLAPDRPAEVLLGQYELPASSHRLLQEAQAEYELKQADQAFHLGDRLTEKLVEQRVRLLQNYFARDVLQNCDYTCVFCGFAPHSLGAHGGLLRASHIKPWARSDKHERVDVRNGLAACPIHDAAFDQGYLSIEDSYGIVRSRLLLESIQQDQGVKPYFVDALRKDLLLPSLAKKPDFAYLEYHRSSIFRDATST